MAKESTLSISLPGPVAAWLDACGERLFQDRLQCLRDFIIAAFDAARTYGDPAQVILIDLLRRPSTVPHAIHDNSNNHSMELPNRSSTPKERPLSNPAKLHAVKAVAPAAGDAPVETGSAIPAAIPSDAGLLDTKTGYKGVRVHNKRFAAVISQNGSRWRIGTYATAVEAARAYDQALINRDGPYAAVNFPEKHVGPFPRMPPPLPSPPKGVHSRSPMVVVEKQAPITKKFKTVSVEKPEFTPTMTAKIMEEMMADPVVEPVRDPYTPYEPEEPS